MMHHFQWNYNSISRLFQYFLLLFILQFNIIHCMKQTWSFDKEDRSLFLIERFGFTKYGSMNVKVNTIVPSIPLNDNQAGLLFIPEKAFWNIVEWMDDPNEMENEILSTAISSEGSCILTNRSSDVWVDFHKQETWQIEKAFALDESLEPGYYYLFYAQCSPGLELSFDMTAEFKSAPDSYLSAGDAPLPTVYIMTFILFTIATIVWLKVLRHNHHYVHRVHHVMTIVIVLKTLSVFTESMRFFYMKTHGDTLTTWTILYYIFVCCKGMVLFLVVVLIGTGWSLLKPHLNARDKLFVSSVLGLQILSNIAMLMMTEGTDLGTRAYGTWRDLLHFVDIICCALVLVPIITSMKQLRTSMDLSQEKKHVNFVKLEQFRSFYLVVVAYLYMTRIVIYLLEAMLPYDYTFIVYIVQELTALSFFCITGYRFRPMDFHPYLEVPVHMDELEEFSLDDTLDEDDLVMVASEKQTNKRTEVV